MDLRYEWRIWAAPADEIAGRIGSGAAPYDTRHSLETYLVSTVTTTANPKIRAGQLDVKVLRTTDRGFEQWEPLEKVTFPVSAAVARSLGDRLGVALPVRDGRYTRDQLITEIVDPAPRLAAVDLEKHRRLFTHGGCLLGIADVSIAGTEVRSAAIESADLDLLFTTAESLGFTAAPNVSYPKMIHRVLGWIDREE